MKKLLIALCAFSLCLTSCSKDEDPAPTPPINKAELVAEWTISEEPVFDIKFASAGYETKIKEQLQKLFKKDDKYTFSEGTACSVSRDGTIASIPTSYNVEGYKITFDSYISFTGQINSNKLTLTAGKEDVKEVLRKELAKLPEFIANPEYINKVLGLLNSAATIKIVLTKVA